MKKQRHQLFESSVVRFLLTGALSTGIDFMIYMMFSQVIQPTVAKGVSMICASVFSYVANKKYTFQDQRKASLGNLLLYYLVFAINLGCNVGAHEIVFRLTGRKIVAFIIATMAGMTVNYTGQKLFVFHSQRKDVGEDE